MLTFGRLGGGGKDGFGQAICLAQHFRIGSNGNLQRNAGAFANVLAIPLVTFMSMPLIALALLLDLAGLGTPVWWLAGQSLELMLWIAHVAASQPGAVKLMPQMGWGTFALFVAGGLWLALWRGRARLWGLGPAALATVLLVLTPTPDVLVSGDGRQVGVVTGDGRLLSLRDTRSEFTRDNLMELAGVEADPVPLAEWPDAECSAGSRSLPALDRSGITAHGAGMSRRSGSVLSTLASSRIALMPSTSAWWVLMYIATRPSRSPSITWASHRGRSQASRVLWSREQSSSSSRTRPGLGSALCRTWCSMSNCSSGRHTSWPAVRVER